MPIVADNFTIPVSLILLSYTVVRTTVYSSVPQYTAVRFLQAVPNPTFYLHILFANDNLNIVDT